MKAGHCDHQISTNSYPIFDRPLRSIRISTTNEPWERMDQVARFQSPGSDSEVKPVQPARFFIPSSPGRQTSAPHLRGELKTGGYLEFCRHPEKRAVSTSMQLHPLTWAHVRIAVMYRL